MLAETAHDVGVITNEEFVIFQNAGYMGLCLMNKYIKEIKMPPPFADGRGGSM